MYLTRTDGDGRKQRNRETSNFTPVKNARDRAGDGKKENERTCNAYTQYKYRTLMRKQLKARALLRFHRSSRIKNQTNTYIINI